MMNNSEEKSPTASENTNFSGGVKIVFTVGGLIFAYFLFLYFRNFPNYWQYAEPGGWLGRGEEEGWISWQASKSTYGTICLIKGGKMVKSYDFFW